MRWMDEDMRANKNRAQCVFGIYIICFIWPCFGFIHTLLIVVCSLCSRSRVILCFHYLCAQTTQIHKFIQIGTENATERLMPSTLTPSSPSSPRRRHQHRQSKIDDDTKQTRQALEAKCRFFQFSFAQTFCLSKFIFFSCFVSYFALSLSFCSERFKFYVALHCAALNILTNLFIHLWWKHIGIN